jgi:multisubunit Na+/H+ antiporter MnhF subunit
MNIQTSKDVEINDVENGLIILTWLSIWNDYVMFSNTICWILIFFSRSNGLLNFRSNGLQVVALMSVFFALLSCQFAQMSFADMHIVLVLLKRADSINYYINIS